MTNLYADIGMFKREYANDQALDSADQTQILDILEAASRAIDDFLGFAAFARTATRDYDGNGKAELQLPDPVLSATTLKYDSDDDHVADKTLTENTDFWLWPDNDSPKWRLDVHPESTILSIWPRGRKTVQIAGTFGYSEATETSGDTVQNDPKLVAAATTLTVADGGKFAVGQTLLIGAEQVYVSAISTNNLTIIRGVNGTTDADHLKNVAIDRYIYVSQIMRAALIQAGRLWKRRETAYSTMIQNPGLGTIEVYRGLDADVQRLLNPLRDRMVLA